MSAIKDQADEAYLLSWKGNKVPRGAKIGDEEIAWTQNGEVISDKGERMGIYDRLVEFGGEDGNEQQMVVYRNK